MAVFIVAPKVMFTCQSESAVLYCDLHWQLVLTFVSVCVGTHVCYPPLRCHATESTQLDAMLPEYAAQITMWVWG